jgi:uncharacterized protein YjdB
LLILNNKINFILEYKEKYMKKANIIYQTLFNLIRNGGGGALLIAGLFALLSCQQPGNNYIPALGITLTPTAASVAVGKTQQLTATVAPTDSSDPIVYKSSDTNIATVDTKGLVMAVKKGTVAIDATAG